MYFEHISTEIALFLVLYGVTGAMPLIAALYLLLRRGNAFVADITPPLRLRRWAATFLAFSSLGHAWWLLFYMLDGEHLSVSYVAVVALDSFTLLPTIAGTLLAMLQDRRRPVWPAFAAIAPFAALAALLIVSPSHRLLNMAITYLLAVYVLFSIYMAFAVRRYGRWLRDNYADLERKEVWTTHVVAFFFMLLFFFYSLVDTNITLLYILHLIELVLFSLLVWRVETLPQLDAASKYPENGPPPTEPSEATCQPPAPEAAEAPCAPAQKMLTTHSNIEQLLADHCVAPQLYLQHDLALTQLAKALGSNRSYLSQYFSAKGTTYNAYINDLRIRHFVNLYNEAIAAQRPFTAQQLACDSGYRSYSTFSLAFKQRMGQSVTAWMRQTGPADRTS